MECNLCGTKANNNGLSINRTWICQKCEHEIINLKVTDLDYELWIERIKKIWDQFVTIEGYA